MSARHDDIEDFIRDSRREAYATSESCDHVQSEIDQLLFMLMMAQGIFDTL